MRRRKAPSVDERRLSHLEVASVTDNDSRADKQQQAAGDEEARAAAGVLPFLEGDTPEVGEDDDAGHVEGPTGEVVFAHLVGAEGVEKELEVPDDARRCGEQVVA